MQLPPVPPLTKEGFADPVWAKWLGLFRSQVAAAATSIAVNTANGFSGTTSVDPSTGVASITLTVVSTGVLKGVGGQLLPAVSGTDYLHGLTITGDASGANSGNSLALALANSGATAGTYGSATVIPQVTVDAKGRVTSITSIAATGAAPGYGTTAARPTSPAAGYGYFDTTLGQPVWVKSLGPVVWVNAAGVVS